MIWEYAHDINAELLEALNRSIEEGWEGRENLIADSNRKKTPTKNIIQQIANLQKPSGFYRATWF